MTSFFDVFNISIQIMSKLKKDLSFDPSLSLENEKVREETYAMFMSSTDKIMKTYPYLRHPLKDVRNYEEKKWKTLFVEFDREATFQKRLANYKLNQDLVSLSYEEFSKLSFVWNMNEPFSIISTQWDWKYALDGYGELSKKPGNFYYLFKPSLIDNQVITLSISEEENAIISALQENMLKPFTGDDIFALIKQSGMDRDGFTDDMLRQEIFDTLASWLIYTNIICTEKNNKIYAGN